MPSRLLSGAEMRRHGGGIPVWLVGCNCRRAMLPYVAVAHETFGPQQSRARHGGLAEHPEVIGDDAQPHPAFDAGRSAIATPREPVPAFQDADATFAPGSPPHGRTNPSGTRGSARRLEHDLPDAPLPRRALVGRDVNPASATASCGGRAKS